MADATILIPNNTTLMGVGQGTVIELADIDVTDNLIENTDQTTGSGVTIQDLQLDGRNDLNTAGNQYGIYFVNMGGGNGANMRAGATITHVIAHRFSANAINLRGGSSYSTISNNTAYDNYAGIVVRDNAGGNTITGNTTQGHIQQGITIYSSAENNSVTGNASTNDAYGILVSSASNVSVTGNTVLSATETGIDLEDTNNSNISANTVSDSLYGISLINSNNNSVSANNLSDNGDSTYNDAIYLEIADKNTITDNTITDISATLDNVAITIYDSDSDNNYLSNNTLGGGSINDAGTGTIYAGQLNNNGGFTFKTAADSTSAFEIQGSGGTLMNIDTANSLFSLDADTTIASGRSLQVNDGSFVVYSGGGVAIGPTGLSGGGYTPESIAYSPRTLDAGATSLSLGDESVSSAISLPFNFTFYNNSYSSVYISSNGWMSFTSTSGAAYSVQTLPSSSTPNNLVAGFSDDLDQSKGGTNKYEVFGTAPNRVFVVEFNAVPEYSNNANTQTFQMMLYEGTNDIEVHTTSTTTSGNVTQGLENIDGTVADYVAGRNHTAFSLTNDAVRFNYDVPAAIVPDAGHLSVSNAIDLPQE